MQCLPWRAREVNIVLKALPTTIISPDSRSMQERVPTAAPNQKGLLGSWPGKVSENLASRRVPKLLTNKATLSTWGMGFCCTSLPGMFVQILWFMESMCSPSESLECWQACPCWRKEQDQCGPGKQNRGSLGPDSPDITLYVFLPCGSFSVSFNCHKS